MPKLSKFLFEQLSHCTCNDILHAGSCLSFARRNVGRILRSNAMYYLPFILLKLLTRIRQVNASLLADALQYFAELVLTGFAISYSIACSVCTFRNISGQFTYCGVVFMPILICGTCVAITSHRVKHLYHTAVFQCFIESVLLQRQCGLARAIANSTALQTFSFMCCSALILHARRSDIHRGFWFLNINKKPKSNPCARHVKMCLAYISRGLRDFLCIGLALDFLKALISASTASTKRRLLAVLYTKVCHMDFSSTKFLIWHVGIYRTVHCALNRMLPDDADVRTVNHAVAAYLAGLAYYFNRKVAVLSYGLLQSWQIVCKYMQLGSRRGLRRFPFAELLFPLAAAYVTHAYMFSVERYSDFGAAIIDGTTANYIDVVRRKLRDTRGLLGK